MYQSLSPLSNIQSLRDPYSFFLTVVSQASKPDGVLAWLQFGLPGQKCRINNTVDPLLTDTSIRRTPLYNGHLELVPAFLYFLYLTLDKMDISLRRTLTAGPKGVCLRGS